MDEERDLQEKSYPEIRESNDIPSHDDWGGWIISKGRNYKINPLPAEKDILGLFFEVRPTCNSDRLAIDIVAHQTGRKPEFVINTLKKAKAREEAKIQRAEYADAIYAEKIPQIQSIVGLSLEKLGQFVSNFHPETIEDAKGLSKIATDMNTLLRLELGKTTQSIELIQRTEKDVTVLLEELKNNDPFVDYDGNK